MTPAQVLDQAFTLLRHARAAQWLRGVTAGLPLAAVVLALYAFVHVVGLRPPLALFGVLCALAYWARFRALSRLSRELVFTLGSHAQAPPRTERLGGFDTAMVAGISSWFWAVALSAAAQSSLTVLLICFPLLCARGAFAPSLLARSACAPESGLRALARASADTRGQRHLFLGVELLALLGLLLVFGNLYALTALALLVASSVLGLDTGFVTALIAPDNEIVPALLLGVAALVLEPLRAAVSALAFQRARERWEGADLQAAIAALDAEPRRRPSTQPRAAVARAVFIIFLLYVPSIANADASDARARDPLADVSAGDARARDRARAILARDEFSPSSTDAEGGTWRQWLAERMRDRELSDRDASAPPRFELRLPSSVLVLGSVLLLSCVGFWLTRSIHRKKTRAAAAARGATAQPTSAQRIAEASRHADEQQFDRGLRSLYAACLSALGRMNSADTNGQVLQRISSPPLKAAFARFTQVIEPCCYGRQRATRADFERARALTAQILGEVARDSANEAQT